MRIEISEEFYSLDKHAQTDYLVEKMQEAYRIGDVLKIISIETRRKKINSREDLLKIFENDKQTTKIS